jgi:hypothetical protein
MKKKVFIYLSFSLTIPKLYKNSLKFFQDLSTFTLSSRHFVICPVNPKAEIGKVGMPSNSFTNSSILNLNLLIMEKNS